MSAHSPGPLSGERWRLHPRDDASVMITTDGGAMVALVYGAVDGGERRFWERLRDERGRLIAAAPELLEALKRAQEWMELALQAFEGNPGPSENEGKRIDTDVGALICRIEGKP